MTMRLKRLVGPHFLPVLNGALRMVLLLAKFFFVIFLAKYSSAEVVVEYGIVVAAVSVAVTLVGLDFYTYANRELMRHKLNNAKILTNQIFLLLIVYLLLLVLAAPMAGFLVSYTIFVGIIVFEHTSQELIRVLIARRSPILATITLMPKAALWIVALVGWKYGSGSMITLPEIGAFWIAGALASFGIGLWFLRHQLRFVNYRLIDRAWITQGLKSALIMLVAGAIARSFFLLDRLIMNHAASVDLVSAYVLFASLIASVYVIVEAAVFQFALPDLVENYSKGRRRDYLNCSSLMALKAISLAVIGLFGIIIFADILLVFIGKQTYLDQHSVLYICAFIGLAYVAFLSTHFVLYSMGRDLVLLTTAAITLAAFISASLAVPEEAGSLSVPIYLAASLVFGVLMRLIAIWMCLSAPARFAPHLRHSGPD